MHAIKYCKYFILEAIIYQNRCKKWVNFVICIKSLFGAHIKGKIKSLSEFINSIEHNRLLRIFRWDKLFFRKM